MIRLVPLVLSYILICDGHSLYEFDVHGEANYGYYISTHMGTPSQNVSLLLDTGSSTLALACSPLMKRDSGYFKYNKSVTFRQLGLELELHYVTGYWKGFLGQDVLNLCENNCSVFTNIGCMLSGQEIFDADSKFQGLIGLAYPSIAKPDSSVLPFIDVFTKTKNVSNIFALFLCGPYFSSSELVTKCGKFHIGNYSVRQFYGDILYTPIIQEKFFEVIVTDVKVDVNHLSAACTVFNEGMSIIDSGTTSLNFPPKVYDWVIENMKKYVKYDFPNQFWLNQSLECTYGDFNVSMFPTLTVSLFHSEHSSFDLSISPQLYILPIHKEQKKCFKLGIGISHYGTMIGATVLKGFYVIFDKENKKVGFANSTDVQNIGHFVSNILGPYASTVDVSQCTAENLDHADISVLTIILLCAVTAGAFLLLYALLLWIWKNFIKSAAASDTSSLMDEN